MDPGVPSVIATLSALRIAPGGRLLVEVWPDGRIDYGEGYDPDEAAKAFWAAMARQFPGVVAPPPLAY